MYFPYEKISPNARIWVYASHQPITQAQKDIVMTEMPVFLHQWTAHKQDLYASFIILWDRFLVIAIDENLQGASGCSIDASVRFVQQLGEKLHLDFLCRDIFFIKNTAENSDTLGQISPLKIKNAVQNNEITPETIIFNQNVTKKQDFDLDNIWQQKAENTFLKKYFGNYGL